MSTEAILTLVGIGVGVVLFLLGLLMTVLGYLLSLQMKQILNRLTDTESHQRLADGRIIRLETWVGIKKPSDTVRRTGETPA